MSEIDRLPPHVVKEVKKRIGRRKSGWTISESDYEWLKNGRILRVHGELPLQVVLFTDGSTYYILNRRDGIDGINHVLAEYRFPTGHFQRTDPLYDFLHLVVVLYSESSGSLIATNTLLRQQESVPFRAGLSSWLLAREKDEAEFRTMFYDPKVQVADGEWMATFDVLTAAGGVDEWRISGTHDQTMEVNRIRSIEVAVLKKKGSYSYPLEGSGR